MIKLYININIATQQEIEDLLKYNLNLFQNLDKEIEKLNKELSEWDKKQDDLLHYIENHNLDVVKSCKAIKLLKQ